MNNEKKAPVRQIKFRAKQLHGVRKGAWWHGYFSKDATGTAYITTLGGVDTVIVDEYTLGQFTGLLDKNGKEIFEGDMVLASMKYKGVTLMPFRAYVFYNESVGSWQIKYETTTNNFATDFIYSYEIEIVGHIHEESEVSNG